MHVEAISTEGPQVDQYVASTPEGKLCHLPRWGFLISEALGHEPLFLVAREGDRIHGVLPLTVVKSRLFGNRIVSQAFSNYGGPLADTAVSQAELLSRAFELARERKCLVMELRNLQFAPGDLLLRDDKVCVALSLVGDPEQVWRSFRGEIRNRVRKAEKCGLAVVVGDDSLLDDFYDLWTRRMRQLGTPCYPRRLFESILRVFADNTRIILVMHGKRAVAAGFFQHFNGVAECRWAAASVDANRFSPNTLLYWSAIKYYCQLGQRVFDFGRSTMGSTQYEFKRRWGGRTVQLYYQYWAECDHGFLPLSPENPRYRRLIEIWRRLPLGVTRFLGPRISSGLA